MNRIYDSKTRAKKLKLCVKADDWFGYGKENTKNKW